EDRHTKAKKVSDEIGAKKAKAEEEAKGKKDAKLEKLLEELTAKAEDAGRDTSFWEGEKKRLETLLTEKTLEALKTDWSDHEAYALAGYRLVVNQCNKCHALGGLQAQQPPTGQGPSLNLASQRLRPEWMKRWISNPQRFVPYPSAMPVYF